MPTPNDELVTIGNYWSSVDAHLARNQLEAAGIRAVLSDEHTTTINWDLSNAIRGIKLQVLNSDADRADAILNSLEEASPSEANEANDPEPAEAFEREDEGREEIPVDSAPVTEEEERTETPWNEREQLADRVYRGAIFGLLLWPLQFWVFVLLIRMFLSDEPLRPEMGRKAMVGACINLVMTPLAGYLFGRMLA